VGEARQRGTYAERVAHPKDPGAIRRRVEAAQAKRSARRLVRSKHLGNLKQKIAELIAKTKKEDT